MAKTQSHSHSHEDTAPVRIISAEEAYESHVNTYRNFLRLTKWLVAITVIILVILYFVVQPHIQPPAS